MQSYNPFRGLHLIKKGRSASSLLSQSAKKKKKIVHTQREHKERARVNCKRWFPGPGTQYTAPPWSVGVENVVGDGV